jgi:hypothetical protein
MEGQDIAIYKSIDLGQNVFLAYANVRNITHNYLSKYVFTNKIQIRGTLKTCQ